MSKVEPPPSGWLNAHAHLELSHLKSAIPGNMPFPEWLSHIVRLKRASTPEESRQGAAAGLQRAATTGTTALFDILSMDTSEAPLSEWASDSTRLVLLFREIAGFSPAEAESTLKKMEARQCAVEDFNQRIHQGVSPHAPYTVTPELFRLAGDFSRKQNQWLCIHAAEVAAETEMLLSGKGAMADFLAPWLHPQWKPPGMRPIPWLASLGVLGPTTLLVHCNDTDAEDRRIIRESGSKVVVCPGTHVYFGRGYFPLADLLRDGVSTYLGTDSLASNEDLDMGREVELAWELADRRVTLETIRSLADGRRVADFIPIRR